MNDTTQGWRETWFGIHDRQGGWRRTAPSSRDRWWRPRLNWDGTRRVWYAVWREQGVCYGVTARSSAGVLARIAYGKLRGLPRPTTK
jgi:hypothetical protein